ncbi:hypothetical protein FACS1894139_04940 [Planctomycetales bacterium]|nr:hypothetical protein FACS1894107_03320 [Planctomycetales bacterium]GHS97019.1 hypothetical protein FACS1894108_02680 [Planctomycetales bacterium]GHT03810.1 hypothetical protein FACS1894139_04940 [Planctomycetales bacterium]GHV18893.1 hypothetical protein AGMMS49959_02010 [Planctomycetales bacterium]
MVTTLPQLTREEKLAMMRSLNWGEYATPFADMLDVVEGRRDYAAPFDRTALFARSLKYIPWYRLVALWGLERMKELYTPQVAARLWPKILKVDYDFIFAILRRETLPASRWGDERHEQLRRAFLSNRWHGVK